jgi:hypothetical protein
MQVKKVSIVSAVLALLIVLLIGSYAMAGAVYDRSTLTLGTTTGTGTWTNTTPYAALSLKRIWIQDALATNGVITVTRVAGDTGYSDTAGTVTMGASTNGSTASFTAAYLKYGDKLAFTTTVATGATAVIEYEVQKH